MAVSNAANAAIAAADVICCNELGERSSSSDHADGIYLLRSVPGISQDAANSLWDILSVKNKAQYSEQNPTMSETKRAIRAMRSLMKEAEFYR